MEISWLQNLREKRRQPIRGYDGGYWIQTGNCGLIPESPFLERLDMAKEAMNPDGANFLIRVLKGGDYECRQKIFSGVVDSIAELISHGCAAFIVANLVDASTDDQFKLIVDKIASQPQFFIDAALDSYRTYYSVGQVIIRLKDSPLELASIVTSILSTKFYELMTAHLESVSTIRHCLLFLGNEPNKVLFEAAINHCSELATHKLGYFSLNRFIDDCKSEVHRDTILHVIADKSDYLSVDAFGKYVVMHALILGNLSINYKICWLLRGLYTQLSSNIYGHRVVMVCIMSSYVGMTLAIGELLEDGNALSQLAQDRCGNYVIQEALKMTKRARSKLYEDLVAALRPHFSHLEHSERGKNLVGLITSHSPDPKEKYPTEGMLWACRSVKHSSGDEPAAPEVIYLSECDISE